MTQDSRSSIDRRTTTARRMQLNQVAQPFAAQKMTSSSAAILSNQPNGGPKGTAVAALASRQPAARPSVSAHETLYYDPVSHELGSSAATSTRLLRLSDSIEWNRNHGRRANGVICRASNNHSKWESSSSLSRIHCDSPRIWDTKLQSKSLSRVIDHRPPRGPAATISLHHLAPSRIAAIILFLSTVCCSLVTESIALQIDKQPILALHDNNNSLHQTDNSLQLKLKPEASSQDSPDRVSSSLVSSVKPPEQEITTTATSETTTLQPTTSDTNNELSGTENDDDHAQGCEGLSADESAEGEGLSDAKRLVNLQSCLQTKARKQVLGLTRSGMEAFESLSLSGGCTSSLMDLMRSLSDLKSFAFKFVDASAKIPSGVMYGLLSDFGDFDECMAARSQPDVSPEQEIEENAYSGKYCLASMKLNYHIKLAPNQTAPDGIIEDGLLWDKLIRNYWLSDSPKGFQIGVCLPSRCTDDDINQLYALLAKRYNFKGNVIGCQDSLELRRNSRPDLVQQLILGCLYALAATVLFGSLADRYNIELLARRLLTRGASDTIDARSTYDRPQGKDFLGNLFRLLTCFSLSRNWRIFLGTQRSAVVPCAGWYSPKCRPLARDSSFEQITEQASGPTSETDVSSSMDETDTTCMGTPGQICKQLAERPDHLVIPVSSGRQMSQLTVKISPDDSISNMETHDGRLSSLSGLRLLMILWITIGHSFLYPSANNYQHYRSIINMNITRDSVWFATTNFTLGIDSLLYVAGLVFVYKSAKGLQATSFGSEQEPSGCQVLRFITKKVLRFWPTYLTVIGLAVIVPLTSDGPMWPEMVSKRLGDTCRRNWWSNLLFMNNFLTESQICLPSSWFVSVLMQLFVIGSLVVLMERKYSIKAALALIVLLMLLSCSFSFVFAYIFKLRAPVIRMDESFVLDVDVKIWRLYINILNSLGPFLIGMLGGYLLIRSPVNRTGQSRSSSPSEKSRQVTLGSRCRSSAIRLSVDLLAFAIMALVLSLVLKQDYNRISSSFYWSLHRIGWAIVTGYVIHNCATGRWRLLNELMSLSTLIPLSRLIFIAYLVYPIYIHTHSGMVRDGLHVSLYNMFSIYVTRLVLTFATALVIHLTVELPFCSIEEIYLNRLVHRLNKRSINPKKLHPLMAVAPVVMASNHTVVDGRKQLPN